MERTDRLPSTTAANRSGASAGWLRVRPLLMAVAAGLALEPGPVLVGSLLGPPAVWLIAPIGFILTWVTIRSALLADGRMGRCDVLRCTARSITRSLGAYGLGLAIGGILFTVTILVAGIWLDGSLTLLIGIGPVAVIAVGSAYVIPCLVDGDDFGVAIERSWTLVRARGAVGTAGVIALLALGLGPPCAVAAMTSSTPPPLPWVLPTVTLAVMGPLTIFGLERIRGPLESSARRLDTSYGRA
jgi:hypothetical protein